MARAVKWAGRAKADLRSAVEYIKKQNPASAGAFLEKALETARSLDELSERGSVMRIVHGNRDLLLALGRRTREETEDRGE